MLAMRAHLRFTLGLSKLIWKTFCLDVYEWSRIWVQGQEESRFKPFLAYIMAPCHIKKKKKDKVIDKEARKCLYYYYMFHVRRD